jgi:YHS domain-containing protein
MKKIIIVILFILVDLSINAQQIDYNTDDGYIAEGYDVVAYFSNKAVKGNSNFSCEHDGVNYKFKNKTNLDLFNETPKKYIPQYGGWCAYAMGDKGEKVTINPKTFEIRDDKLYLFYNAYFTNTFESWKEEGPEKVKQKADKNWEKIKYKS